MSDINNGWSMFPMKRLLSVLNKLTDKDLESNALKKGSKLSSERAINAYAKIISHDKNEKNENDTHASMIAEALNGLQYFANARIVDKEEFNASLNTMAQHLCITFDSIVAKKQIGVFPIETYSGRVKSNIWVLFKVLRELSNYVKLDELPLFVAFDDGGDKNGKQRRDNKIVAILVDDCTYSGMQMTDLLNKFVDSHSKRVTDVIIATPFTTSKAMSRLGSCRANVSMLATRVVGYDAYACRDISSLDLAIMMRSKLSSSSWMCFSLFQVMGTLSRRFLPLDFYQYADEEGMHDKLSFMGSRFICETRLIGEAAIIFAHKVADTLSIPIQWIIAGPTIRHALELICKSSLCEWKEVDAVVVNYEYFLTKLVNSNKKISVTFKETYSSRIDKSEGGIVSDYVVVSDSLVQKLGGTKKTWKVNKLPQYVPLLEPVDACGEKMASLIESHNNSEFWSDGVYNSDLPTCTTSVYSTHLYKRLVELNATFLLGSNDEMNNT